MNFVLGVLLLASSAAASSAAASATAAVGIEEIWRYDTGCGLPYLPVVLANEGQGGRCVFVASRLSNSILVLNQEGQLTATLVRPERIAAGFACNSTLEQLLFEEGNNHLVLVNRLRPENYATQTDNPLAGARSLAGLAFADLDADGLPEVLRASRDGTISVFDRQMVPRWQYHTGETISGEIAAAPVFDDLGAVYAVCSDGTVHGLAGDGTPLWRRTLKSRGFQGASNRRPLVAQLAGPHPSVLVTDAFGTVTAIDAVTGDIQWAVRVGNADAGTPAVIAGTGQGAARVVVVDERGRISVLDRAGRIVERGALPTGVYVPRPLAADIDGDGSIELLLTTMSREIVVASFRGEAKQTLPLPGNASQGMILSDINSDALLELLAVTDCGRVVCYATRAINGWMHPAANPAMNGAVPPLSWSPFPETRKRARGARVESVTLRDYVERAPYGGAFVRPRPVKGAETVSAVIRRAGTLVGSTFTRLKAEGFFVPFIQMSNEPVTLDLRLYSGEGKLLVASSNIPIRSGPIRLIDLLPVDSFVEAVAARADAFSVPASWRRPVVLGRDYWSIAALPPDATPVSADAIVTVCDAGDNGSPLFGPEHRAWNAIKQGTAPFFVAAGAQGRALYTEQQARAIQDMAGKRFLGFSVPAWSDDIWSPLQRGTRPELAGREAATEMFRQEYARLANRCGGHIFPGQAKGLFHHQLMAWGAPGVFCETGGDSLYAPMQFAFLRGASRQYGGKPWGVSISPRPCGSAAGQTPPGPEWERRIGAPPQLGQRLEAAAYLSGATFIDRQFCLAGEPVAAPSVPAMTTERGIPYTPIAFMLDFNNGWRPADDIFGTWPLKRGDRSISTFMRHVYGWEGLADLQRGQLTSSPYGDVFDVIVNGTDDGGAATLRQYGVVWPLGDVKFEKDQVRDLVDYVDAGGILVLDAPLASYLRSYLPGIRFTGTTSVGTQVQTALAAMPPVAAPYRYHVITPGNTPVLAWTDSGDPLVVWRPMGKGVLILGATDHWLDETNHLLPVAEALLRALADAFMPIQIPPNFEVILNSVENGWIVGLINNNGPAKRAGEGQPAQPAGSVGSAECILHFKKGAPLRFTPLAGQFKWSNADNGLTTTLEPGQTGIVRVTLQE